MVGILKNVIVETKKNQSNQFVTNVMKWKNRKKSEFGDKFYDTTNQTDLKSFMSDTEKWLDQKNNKSPLWNYMEVEINKTFRKHKNS